MGHDIDAIAINERALAIFKAKCLAEQEGKDIDKSEFSDPWDTIQVKYKFCQ